MIGSLLVDEPGVEGLSRAAVHLVIREIRFVGPLCTLQLAFVTGLGQLSHWLISRGDQTVWPDLMCTWATELVRCSRLD